MDYPEKKENVEYRRADVVMDVWLGWLAAAVKLEQGYTNQVVPPNTCGRC